MIERIATVVGVAAVLASAGCFGDPAPSETGASTTAATGSTSSAATTSGTTDADGDPATTTPPDGSTSVATAEGSTGPATTTAPGTDSSTGGDPPWVAECTEAGLVVAPIPPVAARRWQVAFTYDAALTGITLGVGLEDVPPDNGPPAGCAPSCTWTWMFVGNEYPPGPTDLSIKSEGVPNEVGCAIVLE